MALELTRQRMRRRALYRFKRIRTCVLARELCLLVRSSRVAFNKEDIQDCCGVVSKLCMEAGCEEASEICAKAIDAIMESEENYLALCEKGCKKCSESRRPTPRRSVPTPDRPRVYVA